MQKDPSSYRFTLEVPIKETDVVKATLRECLLIRGLQKKVERKKRCPGVLHYLIRAELKRNGCVAFCSEK